MDLMLTSKARACRFQAGQRFPNVPAWPRCFDFGIAPGSQAKRSPRGERRGSRDKTLFDPERSGALTPAYGLRSDRGPGPYPRDDVYASHACVQLITGRNHSTVCRRAGREGWLTPKQPEGVSAGMAVAATGMSVRREGAHGRRWTFKGIGHCDVRPLCMPPRPRLPSLGWRLQLHWYPERHRQTSGAQCPCSARLGDPTRSSPSCGLSGTGSTQRGTFLCTTTRDRLIEYILKARINALVDRARDAILPASRAVDAASSKDSFRIAGCTDVREPGRQSARKRSDQARR